MHQSSCLCLSRSFFKPLSSVGTIKVLKLPDAIIAATAIVHDFTLLSTNDSDFNKITALKYRSLTA
ncbi:MAG: PIN domain-containing protein [Cytophagaceae bacterium]|nr:MAG: PIN domain-containing protein [Cytophagaceae bacterium]